MTAHGLKRLDGYWPDLGLGVEIDGREFHNTAGAFVSDRVKLNAVLGLGLVMMRFAVSQVMNEEEYVLAETETIIVARRAVLGGYVSHFPK
jgi:very-short-patch-repair endonuclease